VLWWSTQGDLGPQGLSKRPSRHRKLRQLLGGAIHLHGAHLTANDAALRKSLMNDSRDTYRERFHCPAIPRVTNLQNWKHLPSHSSQNSRRFIGTIKASILSRVSAASLHVAIVRITLLGFGSPTFGSEANRFRILVRFVMTSPPYRSGRTRKRVGPQT
jgi:hypothetical protein